MRARSLSGHLEDPFDGLDGESGLTVHGAGLFRQLRLLLALPATHWAVCL